MSTVFMDRVVLPSAAMLTIATDVVGATAALNPIATPRPRRFAPVAAIERRAPVQARSDRVEHPVDRGIAHDGAAGVRAAVAQDVLAAKLDRIDAERARDHVGVALVGPNELRNAEAAQRARRRAVGVELEGIDADVVDVVGTGGGEARLLRHARADIGIGAAIPQHVAVPRGDAAVIA